MTTSNTPDRPKRTPIPARLIFSDPWCFLAFGFGSGLAPKAPGTFGTLAAIPVFLLMAHWPLAVYTGVTVLLFLLGILICERCEQRIQVSDHSGIVWDEVVGLLITLIGAPLSWQSISAGFVLFRLFDILKPWPIRRLDRSVHGGFGIMLDDAVAGLLAAVCLQGLLPVLGQ